MVKTFFAVASMLALSLLIASPNSADHCDGCYLPSSTYSHSVNNEECVPCFYGCYYKADYYSLTSQWDDDSEPTGQFSIIWVDIKICTLTSSDNGWCNQEETEPCPPESIVKIPRETVCALCPILHG